MSGTLRTPRYRVTLNGQPLDGVTSVWVSLPFCYRVGQFGISKAFLPNDPFGPSWWAATANQTMLVAIELSSDGVSFQQVISGNVDFQEIDPVANEMTAMGRDLAAALCDTRILGTYRNQTASEIVTRFAAEHGLQANITPTAPLIGRYYSNDFDAIASGNFSKATSEWDLLCRLGSIEGIVPYVFGNTLYFNPPPNLPPIFPIQFSRNPDGVLTANVTELQLGRHMDLACDVAVTVRSWHSRSKRSYSATVRGRAQGIGLSAHAPVARYLVVIPNLTQAQCLTKAQQLALEYARHERNIVALFPSLGLLTPQTAISLSGTGSDYDTTYLPQAVRYSVSFEGGAQTEIFAKSSSNPILIDDDTGEMITRSPGP